MCATDIALHSAPRVPPESSDAIIDYLRSLVSCATTNRYFLPRTLHRRFQTITIRPTSYKKLLALLDRTPDIGNIVRRLTAMNGDPGAVQPPTWTSGPLATLFLRLLPL